MFLFESCNFALFLVAIVLVDTSEPPTAVDNCNDTSDCIDSTVLVTVPPASFKIVTSSSICNSVVKLVPKPVTAVALLATVSVPVICKLSP